MTATDTLEHGTVVAGRYRVEGRLGVGGMGSVYSVEHVHTGQKLALKVLNPKLVENAVALERFRREARAPARIESDHVVKVTDADIAPELGGAPFLVMELLQGETFEQLLGRTGKVQVAEALSYLRQIARALDKAHAIGIVHRDIKPENLFLTRRDDGTACVKLLDFGIAKLGAIEGSISKTAPGELLGTPLYMSPEQTLGKSDQISAKTDIWALGVIAHRLLTGSEPWTAEALPHLIAQIAYEPLPVPSQLGCALGPAYDAWFARCCARDPASRFGAASEAISALADALGLPDSEQAPRSSLSEPSHPRVRFSSDAAALAETALGAASPMSDTLAAQVAPQKRQPKLVYLAAIGGLVAAGVVALSVSKRAAAPEPDRIPAAPVVSAPVLEPVRTRPSETTPLVAPTVAEPAPAPDAPTASAPPPKQTARPISKKSKPTTPGPAAAAPLPTAAPNAPPAPRPKRDPLGGRH